MKLWREAMKARLGIIGWFVLFGFLAYGLRLPAETLTVASYNVENYLATNRMVEGTYRQDYPKPEAAKQALRAVIRALNADVIALEEMGPRPYLDELQRDLAREGLAYPHAELLEAADVRRRLSLVASG